jgi:hypothetical protein
MRVLLNMLAVLVSLVVVMLAVPFFLVCDGVVSVACCWC